MTMPAWDLRRKAEACLRLVVQIPDERPNSVSLATARASSKSATLMTEAQGPKISSRLIRMPLLAPRKTAGAW